MNEESAYCVVCLDGEGFFLKPCPSCQKQKPLDEKHAEIYCLPVGHLIKLGDLALWTGRRWRAIRKNLAVVQAQKVRWSGVKEVIA